MSAFSAAVLALSPQAYYRLGEAAGTNVADSSGNGRNGTIQHPANTIQGVPGLVIGDSDTAYQWTTTPGNISLPTFPGSAPPVAFTVIMLMKSANWTPIQLPFCYWNNGYGARSGHPAVTNLNKNNPQSQGTVYTDTSTTLNANQAYFLAFQCLATGQYTSVNGNPWVKVNNQGVPGGPSFHQWAINAVTPASGAFSVTNALAAVVDEIAIFPSALTQSQILELAFLAGYAAGGTITLDATAAIRLRSVQGLNAGAVIGQQRSATLEATAMILGQGIASLPAFGVIGAGLPYFMNASATLTAPAGPVNIGATATIGVPSTNVSLSATATIATIATVGPLVNLDASATIVGLTADPWADLYLQIEPLFLDCDAELANREFPPSGIK
jgi:hypothetical protein